MMKQLDRDDTPTKGSFEPAVGLEDFERIRDWSCGSFRLELSDTGRIEGGKPRLAYRFFDARMGEEPVFCGEDFFASPLNAIDSDTTVAALLTFLSLQPADLGSEYFVGLSRRQMKWIESYADELALLALELRGDER